MAQVAKVVLGAKVYAALGVAGGIAAKLDEGNWGSCKLCGCGKCSWDIGSFGGKLLTVGLGTSCAYKRCICGHHFTQHNRF